MFKVGGRGSYFFIIIINNNFFSLGFETSIKNKQQNPTEIKK